MQFYAHAKTRLDGSPTPQRLELPPHGINRERKSLSHDSQKTYAYV